jgi:disulfide bond formation protein DsbB
LRLPLALGAFVIGNPGSATQLVALAALAILTSGLIGGYHAGVEYGWWEGLTTCSSTAVRAAARICSNRHPQCAADPLRYRALDAVRHIARRL